MSAANAPVPSHSFQDEARANEPSMEEILASIRRIIADEDSLSSVRRDDGRRTRPNVDAPARGAYPAPALDRRQGEPSSSLASERRGEKEDGGGIRRARFAACDLERETEVPASESELASAERKSVAEQRHLNADIRTAAPISDAPLLSAEVAATVASQFQALEVGVAVSENDILNKCVQEMLRPMLQQWLDENLPSLVERLVSAEIERILRGNRRSASAPKPV